MKTATETAVLGAVSLVLGLVLHAVLHVPAAPVAVTAFVMGLLAGRR